jgi:hypothetical protein
MFGARQTSKSIFERALFNQKTRPKMLFLNPQHLAYPIRLRVFLKHAPPALYFSLTAPE